MKRTRDADVPDDPFVLRVEEHGELVPGCVEAARGHLEPVPERSIATIFNVGVACTKCCTADQTITRIPSLAPGSAAVTAGSTFRLQCPHQY